MNLLLCEAIRRRMLLEFDYDGLHRIAELYDGDHPLLHLNVYAARRSG